MAEKALPLYLWVVMISVICLTQKATAQTEGGGGGGPPDGNGGNKVEVRGSNSNPALSRTGSSSPASLNSSKVVCKEWTTYKSCSDDPSATECSERVTYKSCSSTTTTESSTEYSNLETPPLDEGSLAAPPPIFNRKLLLAW